MLFNFNGSIQQEMRRSTFEWLQDITKPAKVFFRSFKGIVSWFVLFGGIWVSFFRALFSGDFANCVHGKNVQVRVERIPFEGFSQWKNSTKKREVILNLHRENKIAIKIWCRKKNVFGLYVCSFVGWLPVLCVSAVFFSRMLWHFLIYILSLETNVHTPDLLKMFVPFCVLPLLLIRLLRWLMLLPLLFYCDYIMYWYCFAFRLRFVRMLGPLLNSSVDFLMVLLENTFIKSKEWKKEMLPNAFWTVHSPTKCFTSVPRIFLYCRKYSFSEI